MKTIRLIISSIFFILATGNLVIGQQGETSAIDSLVSKYTNENKFTGSLLVSMHGKIWLDKGYGFRNVREHSFNDQETVYCIASLTKSFTACLILQLQQAGKLSVQDKLSRYYPGYPNGERITIHQLLTHTSGIFNYTDDHELMSGDQTRPRTLQQMINTFKNKPVRFAPGEQFSYCNSGYILLGYVIEKITGKTYGRVLNEMIFTPLGMKHTYYGYASVPAKDLATGYDTYSGDRYQKAGYVDPSISYSTGAIYSTTGDLHKWHQAWQNKTLLDASSTEAAYTKNKGYYGYGWSIDSILHKQRLSHSGSIAGYKANINRVPADDLCVVALSNSSNVNTGEIVRKIMFILYHQPIPASAAPMSVPDSVLRQYVGHYEAGPQAKLDISVKEAMLMWKDEGPTPFELIPMSKDVFRFKDRNIKIEFRRNDTGKIEELWFFLDRKIIAKKIY